MTGKLAWFGAIISGCAMAAACGSSSSNGGSPTDGGLGDATAPSGDDSGSPGDDGSAGPPVTCGSTTCQAPSGLLPLAACCMPDNSCGGTFSAGGLGGFASMFGGGAAFDAGAFDASAFGDASLLGDGGIPCLALAAGTQDPACTSLSVFGMTLAGCCTTANVCGNDLSLIGLGCNSLAALAGGAAGPGVPCGDGGAVVTPDAQADGNVPDVAVDAPADSPSE